MPDVLSGISNDAVKEATGKGWDSWIKILDKAKLADSPHKEIAQYLSSKHKVKPWWSQSITVGYEYAKGRRVKGQTESQGFEIGAQKTIDMTPKATWQLLMSPKGLKVWLGDALNFKPLAGYGYRTADGISGEIRTVTIGQKLRISWKRPHWRTTSVLQLYLVPTGGKTSIRIHQEKLRDADQRTEMKQHWQAVLEKIQKIAK